MRSLARCEKCGAAFIVLRDPDLTSSGIHVYQWCGWCLDGARRDSWHSCTRLAQDLRQLACAIERG